MHRSLPVAQLQTASDAIEGSVRFDLLWYVDGMARRAALVIAGAAELRSAGGAGVGL